MNIKILVCYHKATQVYARKDISGEALAPIFVGAKNAAPSDIAALEKVCKKT